jgi:hypothetical protein
MLSFSLPATVGNDEPLWVLAAVPVESAAPSVAAAHLAATSLSGYGKC